MFRIHHINLALVAGSLAILAYAAAPSPAGSYVSTYPAAPVASETVSTSSAAPVTPTVLEYFYFSPAQPAKPASAGWVSGGQYSLPPGAEAVTIEASAFGSITAGPGGAQYQTFVVRLTIANSGAESLMMAPSSMRFMDESGHLVTGATAYSGAVRVSTDTVGPGGRDELQLEFGLPPVLALKGLGPVDVDVPYAYGDTSYLTELRFIPAPPPIASAAAALPAYPTSNVYNNYNYYNEYTYPEYAYPDYAYYPTGWWGGWPWWWVGGDFIFFGHRHHFFEELFEHGRHHEFGEHEHHEFGEHGDRGPRVSGTSGHRFNGEIGHGPTPMANVTTGQPLISHRGFVRGPTEHAFVPQVETPHAMTEQHFAPQIQTPQFTKHVFTPPSVTPRVSERSAAPQPSGRTFTPPSVTPRFTERSFSPPSVTPRFSERSSAPRMFSSRGSGGGEVRAFRGGGSGGDPGVRSRGGGGNFHGGGRR